MADLIACSTVLHNKTISDQMNEITALKQKLKVYEPSKVEYTNRLEYETLKTSEYKKIKERNNNCTGDFISHASVPREEGKKYKVIAGTDGLWELIHDEAHNEFLIDRKNQSEAVVKFADTLWTKDWNYGGAKTTFPQWNIDDVAVAIWSD